MNKSPVLFNYLYFSIIIKITLCLSSLKGKGMPDLVIVDFKREPSTGYRVDYTAIFSDGQEVPFTIHTDNQRRNDHKGQRYAVGRIQSEKPRTLSFSSMAFDKTRLAIEGSGCKANFDFASWLLEGQKIKVESILMTH
jgi:hypothetical protein